MDVNHLEYFLEGVPLYICGPGYVGGGARVGAGPPGRQVQRPAWLHEGQGMC